VSETVKKVFLFVFEEEKEKNLNLLQTNL